MAIEHRDAFLIRAELQGRHARAAEERLAREARRAVAQQVRAERAAIAQDAQRAAPGRFGWLRRLAGQSEG